MERLTIRSDVTHDINYNNESDPEGTYNILDLAKYSESGDGSESHMLLKISKHLAEYEDLEEQGLLVRLPCKVGGTVYLTTIGKNFIIEDYSLGKSDNFKALYFHCRCTEHDKTNRKGEWAINVCPRCAFGEKCFQGFRLSDFGKTVFLTKEAAEKALEEKK